MNISQQPEAARAAPRRLWRSPAERAADNAAARARAARLAIEEQRAVDQREMERLEAAREMTAIRDELAQHAQARHDEAAAKSRGWRQRISRAVVLASSNVGVNAVAVLGQVLGLTLGMGWPWWVAVPVALVAESIAVNVGYISHDKLIHGYSAGWLRFLSYLIGCGVGWFNYVKNSDVVMTKEYALVFGACSLLSPVLWQIYSQWRHWEKLRTQGLLEARAPKFSKLRWLIPSLRRETWRAFKHAVSEGIQSPDTAITAVRSRAAVTSATQSINAAQAILIAAQGQALELASLQRAAEQSEIEADDETGDETPDETPDETRAKPVMWAYWQRVVEVERRIPTGVELATVGKCSPQYGGRLVRQWLADMDGRTRNALLPKKSTPQPSLNGSVPTP